MLPEEWLKAAVSELPYTWQGVLAGVHSSDQELASSSVLSEVSPEGLSYNHFLVTKDVVPIYILCSPSQICLLLGRLISDLSSRAPVE